jgi:hypothetical protein
MLQVYVPVPLLLLPDLLLVFLNTFLVSFVGDPVFLLVCESQYGPLPLELSFQVLDGNQDFQLFDIGTREVNVHYLFIWVICKDLSLQVIPKQRLQLLERLIVLVFG